ncbi:hypothetical protein JR316_0012293 [Psilocybe cubensis]|uniref:Uncharacterized protein n=2 Tax=Psilocybe cubensis TaxID=181762 RepID=A0ACB8GIF3_PSICU|nr:hypothetical protein JR316_0012293 [Psilocybe cubensis]KAH9475182.1 hypothetical protein JR316_0012293 [Psilocybe cubensis]
MNDDESVIDDSRTPTAQNNSSTSISSLLVYMQRRLSDIVGPDSRSGQTNLVGREAGFSIDNESQSANVPVTFGGGLAPSDSPVDTPVVVNNHVNESPSLHRAGLLQPKSYNAPSFLSNSSPAVESHLHDSDSIRAATLELSNMPFLSSTGSHGGGVGSFRSFNLVPEHPPTREDRPGPTAGGFIFPQSTTPRSSSISDLGLEMEPDQTSLVSHSLASSFLRDLPSSATSTSGSGSGLDSSIATLPPAPPSDVSDHHPGEQQPRTSPEKRKPSGIALLRPLTSRSSSLSSTRSASGEASKAKSEYQQNTPTQINVIPADPTPTATPVGTPRPQAQQPLPTPNRVHWRSPTSLARPLGPSPSQSYSTTQQHADESTPLLQSQHHRVLSDSERSGSSTPDSASPPPKHRFLNGHIQRHEGGISGDEEEAWGPRTFFEGTSPKFDLHLAKPRLHVTVKELKAKVKAEVVKTPEHARTAVKAIPAVLLGCLLNILDGVSYGMIIFPATGVFADLGPMGVSMFFVSAVVSQLVYTFGGSGFAGANGSMMIEVVPFFHILATSIASEIGEDQPLAIVATTLVAYAFSSILTGLAFFLLGALKLGVVVGFFPRHILVGCIGGVGAFLIETGLTVSMRISEEDFTMSWETIQFMFLDSHNLILWTLPLALAIILRIITHKFHHQLIFPAYFIIIPIIFYIVVFAAGLDLGHLRRTGWIFDMGASAQEPWYKFYSYFNFGLVRYSALWSTLPTQFALLFFNILHPPLNVPALAVSLNDDVDTNKELVAHGYSNLLAGLIGTVPNYLVYVNTLLFYRVGGDNRISGFLLAVATAILLVIGTAPIAFIPIMVVGALIFVLGIDLVKEAVWDNRHRVSWSEYITIISIMVCMTVWDFVIGVLFGIIVCCFFFVVQNSQLRSVRAMYTGDLAMSAVRRPSLQRAYIREVSKQTTILRLQGFLFFGTITYVEETIRSLLEGPYWEQHLLSFLVLDLSLVAGIDMSSAEAFVRIQRLLAAKRVTLVFCGFTADSPIGNALRSVDVIGTNGVELFTTFSDAMEWTENAYLRAWFRSQKMETSPHSLAVPSRRDADIEYSHLVGSFVRSPRRSHLRDVGDRTIAAEVFSEPHPDINYEPLNAVAKAFSSYGHVDPVLFRPISRYLERISIPAGHVLWRQGDQSNGLYVIESGVMRASYQFAGNEHFEESMVAGTLAGEMSALADSPRNATVVAEQPSVLWKFSNENIQRLQVEEPELARVFIQLVLKAANMDYDILLSAIASRQ